MLTAGDRVVSGHFRLYSEDIMAAAYIGGRSSSHWLERGPSSSSCSALQRAPLFL